MRSRLRTLKGNLDPLNGALFVIVMVGLGWNFWLALSKPWMRPGVAATVLGLVLPYFIRDWLVAHCRAVSQVTQVIWMLGILVSLLRPPIQRGGAVEVAVWLGVGLYLGVHFWLLSDRRIVSR